MQLNHKINHLVFRSVLLLCGVILSLSSHAKTVELTTSQGKLIGTSSATNNDISVFKGIPFAKPPVGSRRWTHSELADTWEASRLATQFSPACMQHPYPEGTFFSRPSLPTSEDCLYLNIWSGAKAEEKLPVMLWIHGGALTRGTAAISAYDGTALASKGVIVVSINYRLDVFGYFSHPELKLGNGQPAANFGTSDQVTALRWVKKYISEYGGDPDNVTIFGESAGSRSVHHLMSTPAAKGLFHRAIGQSGSSLESMSDARLTASASNQMALNYQLAAKAESLADLKQIDAASILTTAKDFRFRPVLDGNIFEDQIYTLFEQGQYNSVPLMVGFNADEGTTLGVAAAVPKTQQGYKASVHKRFGTLADEFLTIYPADDLYRSTMDAFRDSFVTWSMQTWAMRMANTSQAAYLYYFTFEPSGEKLGAYHAAEIVYAFNNIDLVLESVPDNHKRLAETMSDYWVSFAKSGTPNANGLTAWMPYSKDNRQYIELGDRVTGKKDLLPGIWEFHDKIRLEKSH